MKAVLVSIGLCLVATAVHSMPLSLLLLNANGPQPVIAVADQCGDRCGWSRSYSRYALRAGYSGGYVTVRDPLIQRRAFCPFGSYVVCVVSGAFCVNLCH
jgi:hypothetical protein